MPTEKAYGIQIASMCKAFAELGITLELVFPFRRSRIKEDFFSYYGIKPAFRAAQIPAPDFYWPGPLGRLSFLLKNFLSGLRLVNHVRSRQEDVIYSRDELMVFLCTFFFKRNTLVFEAHKFSPARRFIYRRLRSRGVKVVVISAGVHEKFRQMGLRGDSILLAPDGVDLDQFDIPDKKVEYRDELFLPKGKRLIGYIGQLKTMGQAKGLEELLLAFGQLNSIYQDLGLVIVGGSEEEVSYYRQKIVAMGLESDSVILTGQKQHNLIPKYLKVFDILVMPFPWTKHYAFYMSPLKLFEYMASKRPIVATRLSSITQILNPKNAVLVEPNSGSALAQGIKLVLDNQDLATSISGRALQDVQQYSWSKRARKILSFIDESQRKS